jgi:hypothetical protein
MKIIEMIAGSRGMGDAKAMAEMLRRMGRRGDTMLAHITPEEAEMLMEAGGSGTINPATGLPEFAREDYDFDPYRAAYDTQRSVRDTILSQPVSGRASSQMEDVPMNVDFESRPLNPFEFDANQPQIQLTRPDQPAVRNVMRDDFTGGTTATYQQQPRLYPEVEMAPRIERTFPTDFQTARLPQYEAVDFGRTPEFRPLEDIAAPAAEPGLAQRAETGLQELQDVLNRYPNLTRAGTAGANILAQALMFNRANQAMRRDIESTRAAAEPFRQAQQEAMGRATGEGLTPEQQQALEIEQARARAQLGARGTPTGSAAAGILAAQQRRARSLARQESFTEALRLANIADQYDRRALEMELQRDQQLAQLFAGILGREVQQAQRTQAPVPTAIGR